MDYESMCIVREMLKSGVMRCLGERVALLSMEGKRRFAS